MHERNAAGGTNAGHRQERTDTSTEDEAQTAVPDGGAIQACPKCGDSNIRATPSGMRGDSEGDWWCRNCDARFDDPRERDPHHDGGGNYPTLGKELLDADPDEVLPDGGSIELDILASSPSDLIGERVVVTSYDGRERTGEIVDVAETASEHDDRALRVEFDERRTTYYVGEGRPDRVRVAESSESVGEQPVPDGGQSADGAERTESADNAEVAGEKPQKTCDWAGNYTGHPCGNEAVAANFARTDSRVNENGVHVSTEVRIVWVCEEHAGHYKAVPDREADVRFRIADIDTNHNEAEPHRLADAEPRTQPGDDDDGPHRLANAEPRTQPGNNGGDGA